MAADRVDPEHHREGRRPAASDQDEPPWLGLRHRTLAALAAAAPERLAARIDFLAGAPIAADPLEVAARGRIAAKLLERGLERAHVGLHLADALEVLVLAERRFDPPAQRVRRGAGGEQERDRPVAELELALDRLRRAVDHPQQIVEPVPGVEGDDARPLGIDPAAPCAAGHLGQLVVGQRAESAVRPLGQSLKDDRAGGHVDAEGHRLRREDRLAEPALEEHFDQPLDARQDSGVMEPDTEPQRLEHALIQHRLGDRRALADQVPDRRVDLALLGRSEQALALGQHVLHGALAPDPAEDEVDRRQPAARLERLDQHGRMDDAPRVPAAAVVGAARLVADHTRAAAADSIHLVDLAGEVGDHVRERHRTMRMVDRHDRPMHDRDPVGDLLDVGDGGREAHQHDVGRRADDDLLPHGAAAFVAHVVAFVEHDVGEAVEPAAVERVAEDLGGHHENRRVRVHLDVAGENADLVGAELAREVGEFLVRERLERSRVR